MKVKLGCNINVTIKGLESGPDVTGGGCFKEVTVIESEISHGLVSPAGAALKKIWTLAQIWPESCWKDHIRPMPKIGDPFSRFRTFSWWTMSGPSLGLSVQATEPIE